MIRTYTELRKLKTLKERFDYLKLFSKPGYATFGPNRYMNQMFYDSAEWKHVRDIVILRDCACDLGVPEYQIADKIIIHHMNPITVDDIINGNKDILNPEYLICCTERTHNAIHYSDERQLPPVAIVRTAGDTKLW